MLAQRHTQNVEHDVEDERFKFTSELKNTDLHHSYKYKCQIH